MNRKQSGICVSIIVPLYKGIKYIDSIVEMSLKNFGLVDGIFNELILVNDYPDETIDMSYFDKFMPLNNASIEVINNEKNGGIHYSRVQGLIKAKGLYVVFLDQDDVIEDTFIKSQLDHIGNADIVVSNGIIERNEYERVLYRNIFSQNTVKSLFWQCDLDCRIASPGQCLIRRDAIPKDWMTRIITCNGSDDYYLWLLMLAQKKKFSINTDILYRHVNTGSNLSSHLDSIHDSCVEVVGKCKGIVGDFYIMLIKRRLLAFEKGDNIIEFKIIDFLNRIVKLTK